MEALQICQICKEQITNYICPDCIAKSIEKNIPRKLKKAFMNFHKFFSHHFDSFDLSFSGISCIKCKTEKETSTCFLCYLNEVSEWLQEKNLNLGATLKRISGVNRMERFEKLMEIRQEETEFGVCDDCGEYSDELKLMNGRWMCMTCGR